MKTSKIIISIFIILLCSSCQSDNEDNQQFSDELILSIFKNGNCDPKLLIGEWDLIKFAYTKDGNKITDVNSVSQARLSIQTFSKKNPVSCDYITENIDFEFHLQCVNWQRFYASISGNLMSLMGCGSTYIYVEPPHDEYDITIALQNAYSFVVKGNELIIYFTGDENKNLLFLKKR